MKHLKFLGYDLAGVIPDITFAKRKIIMGKVYFKVNTTTEDPNREVTIRIRFKDGKVDQSTTTGEQLKLQHWDLAKQKFKRTRFPGKDKMINRLDKLKIHVLDEALKTSRYEKGWLFGVVDKKLHPEKYKKKLEQTMFEWIEAWIDRSENTYHAIRPYHSALNDMRDFNPELDWAAINFEFYEEFVRYLKGKDYSKNTISARIKNLKVFCNAALERGMHTNIAFKSFKKQTEESFNVYLNETELDTIYCLDLSSTPYLDRARDIFLVGCRTGCRFSDLHKVSRNNIENDMLYIEQQKTEKRVVIPLHPIVKSILEKYAGELPLMISNQKFNEYVKKVCKRAKLTNNVSKGITKGGIRKTLIKEKWQMVTSHTARRSFATNLYKDGFPAIGIMAITGHKTERAFLSYIKVNEEEHAEMLLKHWTDKTQEN
ncbi:MAG: tyrosine-type recombinase/integrase [Tannerellaceae bacterium]|nr:tyrosine-type recombinase/integrase [Tannerellaceae bacterium]